ncbi:hypothetical protein LguiA_003896 [Lonicera macranthoides]
MASYNCNSPSEPAKMEQIIPEFFAKCLHIILESRCPYASSRSYSVDQSISSPCSSSSSSSSIRLRDKCFNLALRDCPAALENIEFYRQSNLESVIVDVILVQRRNEWDPNEFGFENKSEIIIERWVVQYASRNSGRRSNSITLSKKLILLLRSLYVTIRLLPAYKLFRELNSSGQIRSFQLGHRVCCFVEPFTHREEAEMQPFVFTPVDTSFGRLSISVFYKSSASDANFELSSPITPHLIPDYVGSPMADPLKRFPSVPVPQYSPSSSSSPFGRRHSWSYDQYRSSPPSSFPSPSPSESRFSFSKPSSHGLPPMSLPRNLPAMLQDRTGNTGFDGYWPSSPMFSVSSSPSQPGYVRGSQISENFLRSESAPLCIPASKLANTPCLSPKKNLPPSHLKVRPSISMPDRGSGVIQIGPTVEKLFTDSGRLSGARISSNSSAQKSVSRNSSRLSYQDDYDDSSFCGPFVLDDDELMDPRSRPGSYDQTGHMWYPHEPGGLFRIRRTQDATVGALHHMLMKAPPLHRQHLTESTNLSVNPNQIFEQPGFQLTAGSSLILVSKTTADALEELRGYREMKDLLLRQGGRSAT